MQTIYYNFLWFPVCKTTKKFEKWVNASTNIFKFTVVLSFFMGPDHKCEWLCLFAVVPSILLWDGFDINQSFLIVSSPRFFSSAVSHSYYHFLMPYKSFGRYHPFSLVFHSFLRQKVKECTFRPEHVFILKITHFYSCSSIQLQSTSIYYLM